MIKYNNKKIKALLLFSGGLDSILAAKIIDRQGIRVTALTFASYFFGAVQAKKMAKENNITLITKDFSKKHFEIVKNPCYGHGAGMNPCIDCHLLMFKEAKKIMKKDKFDFVATGEILGQRPMSQNIEALKIIEREAKLQRKILRPLSAKVLPETEMERLGIVDRRKLLGISGRGRKDQIELAKKYNIKNYPAPAGGCILADKEYSKKLRELIGEVKAIKDSDLKLLRLGRHFWDGKTTSAGRQAKVILGRNHEENLALKKLAERRDMLIEPKNFPGPLALVRGKNKTAEEFAKEKISKYAKKLVKKHPKFRVIRL